MAVISEAPLVGSDDGGESRVEWLTRINRLPRLFLAAFVLQLVVVAAARYGAFKNWDATAAWAGGLWPLELAAGAGGLKAWIGLLLGGGAVGLLGWNRLSALSRWERTQWLVSAMFMVAPACFALKVGSLALYATAGLALWYWPQTSDGRTFRIFQVLGLAVAIGVLPWLGLCLLAVQGRQSQGKWWLVLLLAGFVAGSLWHRGPAAAEWFGSGDASFRRGISLVASVEWLARPLLEEWAFRFAQGGALLLAGWLFFRGPKDAMGNLREATACIGAAVLLTPGATLADAAVLLVPLALSLAPLRQRERVQMAWAAPLLALVLAWKDYAFPWFRELMPLANTGLLLAVVLAALSPAHRIVRLCAEGRTFVRLAMKGRSWLCLGMIATGGAALWLGRMTDDLVINGRSWLLAAGRPHLLLLLASITLHLLLVGRMLTARLLEKGGAHA